MITLIQRGNFRSVITDEKLEDNSLQNIKNVVLNTKIKYFFGKYTPKQIPVGVAYF